jgi:hypothetical protein
MDAGDLRSSTAVPLGLDSAKFTEMRASSGPAHASAAAHGASSNPHRCSGGSGGTARRMAPYNLQLGQRRGGALRLRHRLSASFDTAWSWVGGNGHRSLVSLCSCLLQLVSSNRSRNGRRAESDDEDARRGRRRCG